VNGDTVKTLHTINSAKTTESNDFIRFIVLLLYDKFVQLYLSTHSQIIQLNFRVLLKDLEQIQQNHPRLTAADPAKKEAPGKTGRFRNSIIVLSYYLRELLTRR
jgi:hypothetical protein